MNFKKLLSFAVLSLVSLYIGRVLFKPIESQAAQDVYYNFMPIIASCGCLIGYLYYKCTVLDDRLNDQRNKGVLADLELATKEDLHKELLKRSSTCIVLRPMDDHDKKDGFQMEVVGLDPISTLSNLQLASKFLAIELKSRGMCESDCESDDDIE